ncbi:ABC transporter substrate-binding protein [Streptodolium elevatio]|uniref:ABC transporter substrate-binding protein n=1 Tax=Streptodolium elevatio TaxID=3157996 RepID=A0ABV3DQ16_9ACTN
MRSKTVSIWVAGTAALAIAATGCTGSEGGAASAAKDAAQSPQGAPAPSTPPRPYDCLPAAAAAAAPGTPVDPAAVYSASSTEPQDLLPGNTGFDRNTNHAVGMLFRGLVDYDPASGKPVSAMMASCTTTDARSYTIAVKPGWTFHNGEKVTAKSYADAWTWALDPANKAAGEEVLAEVDTVKAADEATLLVTLDEADSSFPAQLGLAAFSPLPSVFFQDPGRFAREPVGNGPFRIDPDAGWRQGVSLTLRRYDAYAGPDKAQAAGVRLEFGSDAARRGPLDVISLLPAVEPGRTVSVPGGTVVHQVMSTAEVLYFPMADPAWSAPGAAKVRQGLSLAIDREAIMRAMYPGGAWQPATDWLAAGVPGGDNACGELCAYDPERARQLVAEGGGVPGGSVTLSYAQDGGRGRVFKAICDSINTALGSAVCVPAPVAGLGELRSKVDARQMTGMFRGGWTADYPSPRNFLDPMFRGDSEANDSGYRNQLFDESVAQARKAADPAKAAQFWSDAQAQLAIDMPALPLWSYGKALASGPNIANLAADHFGTPVWTRIGVKAPAAPRS